MIKTENEVWLGLSGRKIWKENKAEKNRIESNYIELYRKKHQSSNIYIIQKKIIQRIKIISPSYNFVLEVFLKLHTFDTKYWSVHVTHS